MQRVQPVVCGMVVAKAAAVLRDEASLITGARAGDRDAQDALIRLYLSDVYDIALRVLGDRDLAQDATQDAIVNAINGIARFRGDSSFRTWMLRIAVNAARSLGRRQWRKREVTLEAVENRASSSQDPASAAVNRDEASQVMALLDRLPPKQRLAVSLRVNQDLSYREIGSILDCSEGAARVNYHLGIKRLRELMS